MSVFLKIKRWPSSRVPYVIQANGGLPVETWFQEVNAAIGFALLVPKQHDDLSFVELTVGGYSISEDIGCKGNGKQTIGGSNKFTIIHELLHALGFKHEQLHRNLPWDDDDPKTVPSGNLKFRINGGKSLSQISIHYEDYIKTINNRRLFDAIKIAYMGRGFSVEANLLSRVLAITDQMTEHWGYCDLDSNMMYAQFKTGLTSLNQATPGGLTGIGSSGINAHCDVLSNQDVAALKFMYPPPPPPPPRDFVVAFTGLPNDSLKLTFFVRSTVNPGRSSRYTAGSNGRVVVHGFSPTQAEIRVEPWPFWSRVRIDPRSSTMLPGGRYTYTATLA